MSGWLIWCGVWGVTAGKLLTCQFCCGIDGWVADNLGFQESILLLLVLVTVQLLLKVWNIKTYPKLCIIGTLLYRCCHGSFENAGWRHNLSSLNLLSKAIISGALVASSHNYSSILSSGIIVLTSRSSDILSTFSTLCSWHDGNWDLKKCEMEIFFMQRLFYIQINYCLRYSTKLTGSPCYQKKAFYWSRVYRKLMKLLITFISYNVD